MSEGAQALNPAEYEQALQLAYEAFLTAGDVAIDVGAHRGRHTLPIARRVLPGGQVMAFEPLPFIRAELEESLRFELPDAGDALRVLPYALGERAAQAEFVVAKDTPECSGLRERVYNAPTALERIPVEVRTLDELAAGLDRLRYIKIDAEGGEYHILAGARGLLRRLRPIVSFEFGMESCAKYEITPADMIRLVGELGYRTFDILGRDVSQPEVFVTSATRQEVWDYLAVPAEQLAVFQERIRPELERFFTAAPPGPFDLAACRSRIELVSPQGPLVVPHGKTERIRVRLTNASGGRWERGGVRLGVQWHKRAGLLSGLISPDRLGEDRAEIPLPLMPGAGALVTVPLRPVAYGGEPLPRGEYEVWLSPVVEGVTWFTDRGDKPLKLPVTVG